MGWKNGFGINFLYGPPYRICGYFGPTKKMGNLMAM
jgi:hypothetical protein